MKGQIITNEFSSNCLIEAIKAKCKNPKDVKLYFCWPYIKPTGGLGSMHLLWEDKNYSYDFSDAEYSDNHSFIELFWYRGYIRRWPKGFARRFAKHRNYRRK